MIDLTVNENACVDANHRSIHMETAQFHILSETSYARFKSATSLAKCILQDDDFSSNTLNMQSHMDRKYIVLSCKSHDYLGGHFIISIHSKRLLDGY